jgi:hypothetical protein
MREVHLNVALAIPLLTCYWSNISRSGYPLLSPPHGGFVSALDGTTSTHLQEYKRFAYPQLESYIHSFNVLFFFYPEVPSTGEGARGWAGV